MSATNQVNPNQGSQPTSSTAKPSPVTPPANPALAKATQSQPQKEADGSIRTTEASPDASGQLKPLAPVDTKQVIGQVRPPSAKFDETKVRDHLKSIVDFNMSYSGKAGMNPHFYLHQQVEPLRQRLDMGERSDELQAAVLALKPVEPKVSIKDK